MYEYSDRWRTCIITGLVLLTVCCTGVSVAAQDTKKFEHAVSKLQKLDNRQLVKREAVGSGIGEALDSSEMTFNLLNCSPWFLPRKVTYLSSGASSHVCSCTNYRQEIVRCDEFSQQSFLSLNYCITYDNESILAVTCSYHFTSQHTEGFWSPLPANRTDLNKHVCGHLNRSGLLCGQCRDGFGVSAYSLDLKCSKCSKGPTGLILFVLTSVVMQTCFFVLILIFRISVTRAESSAFVLLCQILASTGAELLGDQLFRSQGMHTIGRLFRAVCECGIFRSFHLFFLLHASPSI